MKKLIALSLILCICSFGGVDLGTDDYINMGDVELATTAISVAFRWNPNVHASCYPVAKYNATSGQRGWAILFNDPNWSLFIGINGGDGYHYAHVIDYTDDFPTGELHDLMFTMDGEDVDAFLDGVSQAINSQTIANGDSIPDAATDLRITGKPFDSRCNGKIYDVAVWDTKLTQADATLYADSKVKRIPLQIKPANLTMYLPLDDFADGSVITGTWRDLSSSGLSGTGTDADSSSSALSETLSTY